MAKKVALYGGSFNPVHIGHLTTILHVLELTDCDRVVVAPVYQHPDGKTLASFEVRMEMLRHSLASMPPHVQLDTIDKYNWEQGGRGLTSYTLKILLSRGHEKIVLVLGSDIQAYFPKWEGQDEIQDMIKKGLVELYWVERSGGASSTYARMAIKHGWSTKHLLQPVVRELIRQKGLYR